MTKADSLLTGIAAELGFKQSYKDEKKAVIDKFSLALVEYAMTTLPCVIDRSVLEMIGTDILCSHFERMRDDEA